MLIAESVSNFSGLWFLLIKDLYNGEGSLKANKSCNISVKLHFFYSAQKYDSMTRYFSFSKREFPKNQMSCLHNAWGVFRKFS